MTRRFYHDEKKCIVSVIMAGVVFLGLFILGACQNDNPIMDIPENYLKVEFVVSEDVKHDELSAWVSIGLNEDERQYQYRLFAYNKQDSVSTENWSLLKDIGLYSTVYRYTKDRNEIDYCHNEQLCIPAELFYGDSGTVCFSLIGDIFVDGESSIQIKQTVECDFIVENNLITIIKE